MDMVVRDAKSTFADSVCTTGPDWALSSFSFVSDTFGVDGDDLAVSCGFTLSGKLNDDRIRAADFGASLVAGFKL